MKMMDRRKIDRQVRIFVKSMPDGYEKESPKEQLISEILTANNWGYQVALKGERNVRKIR